MSISSPSDRDMTTALGIDNSSDEEFHIEFPRGISENEAVMAAILSGRQEVSGDRSEDDIWNNMKSDIQMQDGRWVLRTAKGIEFEDASIGRRKLLVALRILNHLNITMENIFCMMRNHDYPAMSDVDIWGEG